MTTPDRQIVLFAYGFRPLFLLAALYAVLLLAPWISWLLGGWAPAGMTTDPVWWHGHEMLFGFAAAIIAGFLLTAVPNWTGANPPAPIVVGGLVALWLAGRVAVWALGAGGWQGVAGAVLDIAFLPAVAAVIAGPLIRAGATRNLVMVLLLAVFAAANLLMHLDRLDLLDGAAIRGLLLATDLVVLLIVVIGGRVVPAFTANALKVAGTPVEIATGRVIDRLAIAGAALVLVADLAGPGSGIVATCALVAGLLNLARLRGWHGEKTFAQPILWVLHLAYAWVGLGFLVKAAGLAFHDANMVHGLTVGAIGTMTLAMTSRVALGHTGRALTVARPVVLAYLFISLAAVLRVLTDLVDLPHRGEFVAVSGAAWILAWLLYVFIYTTVLIRPRPDGVPG